MTNHSQFRDLLAAGPGACRAPETAGGEPPVGWLIEATDEDVLRLLTAIRDDQPVDETDELLLSKALRHLCLRQCAGEGASLPGEIVALTLELYRALDAASRNRGHLLQLLVTPPNAAELACFAELLVSDPPLDRDAVALSFGPLFQSKDYDPRPLFPQLLEALSHPSVAVQIMDLANFVTRNALLTHHPALPRKDELIRLLGSLVQRLGQLEQQQVQDAALRNVAQQVDEGVSLIVSLCDALALIGDADAVGKLYQAMELHHRRLRTEAAAALARLGEEAGRETLLDLASEPVCRLRVLAYAEELDLGEGIDERYTTPEARAEAELALWLAQPAQFGIPPTRLERVDSQQQYWPGFDEPVECFLFRFVYQLAGGTYSNIGIGGPLTHALLADLADLPVSDIYAMFAGWQVRHDEIYETEIADLEEVHHSVVTRWAAWLQDAGYEAVRPLVLGSFLGDAYLVAAATRQGNPGTAIADEQAIQWLGCGGVTHPLGPREAICLYKGRRLLRTFNA